MAKFRDVRGIGGDSRAGFYSEVPDEEPAGFGTRIELVIEDAKKGPVLPEPQSL